MERVVEKISCAAPLEPPYGDLRQLAASIVDTLNREIRRAEWPGVAVESVEVLEGGMRVTVVPRAGEPTFLSIRAVRAAWSAS